MPFGNKVTKPFNQVEIEALRPGQMGVYGIFRPGRWIYVGSGDIRERLLRHLNGENPCITRSAPTHWMSEVTPNYLVREKELIAELGPSCNQRLG